MLMSVQDYTRLYITLYRIVIIRKTEGKTLFNHLETGDFDDKY